MRTTSIKRRFFIFSVILFLVILVGGGAAFFVSMGQIIRSQASEELSRIVETRRLRLEGQVSSEITLALKLACSPLVQSYFLNPGDAALERLAFAELAGYRAAFTGNNIFWISDADKRYYFGDEYVYTLDPTDPDSAWYGRTLGQEEAFNFNINYDIGLKKTMLWINALVREEGRAIGIAGTGIDLTNFINALFPGGSSGADSSNTELFLFNDQGEITGARDSALMEEKKTLALQWGAGGKAVEAAAKTLDGEGVKTFAEGGILYAVVALPRLNWYMTAAMPLHNGLIFHSSMAVLFMLMILAMLAVFIIINVFTFRMVRPLNAAVTRLTEIADTWDLTHRFEIMRNDETGKLSEILNLAFGRIKDLIKVIHGRARSLAGTGTELAEQMLSTAGSVAEITSAIQTMRKETASQVSQVNQVGSSMASIIELVGKLNGNILRQSESVDRSSAAIEEMFANIHSVVETLERNADNVHSLEEASGVNRSDLQNVSVEFQDMARQSEGLLEINSVIENIASQTNLLSMNAAIEAAHAGEAGKGFAVVAGEIRKLAEDSGRQAKTTTEMLKKIKSAIDKITQSIGCVLKRFEDVDGKVKTIADQQAEIRGAMEEQETGGHQIMETVTTLRELTVLVREEAAEIEQEGQMVITESGSLKNIAAGIERGMNEMASGAEHIKGTITRINEISGENKQSIDTLTGEVMKFKV